MSQGGRTDERIADAADDSARQILRYIRLTNLIPGIIDLVDNDRIKFNPAVELSFISEANQKILYDIMEADQCTPSHAQAIRMKQAEVGGYLNSEHIAAIMQEEKGNQAIHLKIPQKSIERFFPEGVKSAVAIETIVKALEQYRAHERNREHGDDYERSRER
jgi:ParB family chromosome partitioning protein